MLSYEVIHALSWDRIISYNHESEKNYSMNAEDLKKTLHQLLDFFEQIKEFKRCTKAKICV